MRKTTPEHIVVELYEHAGSRQRHELGAFVRFCVFRLEREFGVLRWFVRIAPTREGFTCFIAVTIANVIVEARGRGFDGVCAAWDALTNVEQGLRECAAPNEVDHLAVATGVATRA
jgi:hypothetical protein